MKKDILTTNEVAAQLSCARTSIINWVNQGELVSFETPGGHRRFKREDIIRFAEKSGIAIASLEAKKENKKKVLVVDDEEDFRVFAIETLSIAGDFEVKEASNGIEAALLTGSWKPDLILLDLHMPQMNGLEFIEQLKKDAQYDKMKIVVLTAYLDDEISAQLSEVDDVICKPIGIKDFVAEIRGFVS